MNQKIRNKTFETNSSTTHNMVIIPDDQYEAWNNNRLYYCRWPGGYKSLIEQNNGYSLFTKEQLEEFYDNLDDKSKNYYDSFEDWASDDFVTSEQWDSRDLEGDEEVYVTKSGDTIHILCEYGYDG